MARKTWNSATVTTRPPSSWNRPANRKAGNCCTGARATAPASRARARRTSGCTAGANGCPRSTCSAGTSYCWPARGAAWQDAARGAAGRLGVSLDAYLVNDEAGELTDAGSDFCTAYGISDDGAVLVRPDGFVAWRAPDGADAKAEAMAGVLSRVLCRADAEQ